jgi:hypothetical protein
VGNSLLSLLVELVMLHPLNHDQVMSAHLWGFVQNCAVPLTKALSTSARENEHAFIVCTDIMDVLERVFISAVRLKVVTPSIKRSLAAVAENVELLLDDNPKFLKHAFIAECHALSVDALSKEHFVNLMFKLKGATSGATKGGSSIASNTLSPPREDLEEFGRAFDEFDTNGNGNVDIYEFMNLFANVTAERGRRAGSLSPELANSDVTVAPSQKMRLGLRTVECGERILMMNLGNLGSLVGQRFTRESGKWQEAKMRSSKSSKRIFTRPASSQVAAAATAAANAASAAASAPAADSHKQKATKTSSSPSQGNAKKRHEQDISLFKKFELYRAGVMGNPRIKAGIYRRRFSMLTVLEKGTPGPPPAPPALSSRRRSMRKITPFDDDERRPKVDLRPKRAKSTNETPESSFDLSTAAQSRMAGAVALTWVDVKKRFVLYVLDHFRFSGSDSSTCILILDTWDSHLIKARIWVYDEEGRKLTIADIPRAAALKLCIPHDLTEYERAMYHAKQCELNRTGVTGLLAMLLASLNHDLSADGLPDRAISLFNEMLNGGNVEVQNTLYEHVMSADKEGKLKAHLGKRLDLALESLAVARKMSFASKDDQVDSGECEHAISTVRFLQLLCSGNIINEFGSDT